MRSADVRERPAMLPKKPLHANPFGGQLFAMRPNGLGLRQLTDASGLTTNPDGSIRVELPGPFAYSTVLH